MRFVLANRLLDHAGGTEVHMLTLGEHLQRLGHEVFLYSPELGPFTDYVRGRGLTVLDSLRELPEECDVVYSQDTIVVYDMAERYPEAFHVFRVCGDTFDFQLPPQLEGVVDLVVTLSDRYKRAAEGGNVRARVLRQRTPIAEDRLYPMAPLRERPRRAVLLGNYRDRDAVVQEAWSRHGIEVGRIGGHNQSYDLASALAEVDIVVAKARAALDAMSCGRAVYVLDALGGDGWVTPENYSVLEADNFSGLATDRIIGVAELERDLEQYDPRMGLANRDLIRQHHHPRDHALELLAAIGRPALRPTAPYRELARLSALQWGWERLFHDLQIERAALAQRVQVLEDQSPKVLLERQRFAEAQLQEARDWAQILQAQLDEMRGTRAWGAVASYRRWRDRVRRILATARS